MSLLLTIPVEYQHIILSYLPYTDILTLATADPYFADHKWLTQYYSTYLPLWMANYYTTYKRQFIATVSKTFNKLAKKNKIIPLPAPHDINTFLSTGTHTPYTLLTPYSLSDGKNCITLQPSMTIINNDFVQDDEYIENLPLLANILTCDELYITGNLALLDIMLAFTSTGIFLQSYWTFFLTANDEITHNINIPFCKRLLEHFHGTCIGDDITRGLMQESVYKNDTKLLSIVMPHITTKIITRRYYTSDTDYLSFSDTDFINNFECECCSALTGRVAIEVLAMLLEYNHNINISEFCEDMLIDAATANNQLDELNALIELYTI